MKNNHVRKPLPQTGGPINLRLDVSDSVSVQGPLEVAASVFLPEREKLAAPPIAIFAVPGGGYSRGYFDMHFPGHEGYSEAEHHTDQGIIFVTCDHIGVGESSLPDPEVITFEMLASAYNVAVRQIAERLEKGTLSENFPPVSGLIKIGIGQSMGGCVTILTQGRHRTFDGIAPLGFSAIHTVLPQPADDRRRASIAAHEYTRDTDIKNLSPAEAIAHVPDWVFPFHWEDVPRDILEADTKGGYPIRKVVPPWGSATIPLCAITMTSPGCVAKEAAAVKVPVLVAVGERDVCPDPRAEPSAYRGSMDISLCIVPMMAHMHNFAGTRALLWDRIAGWCQIVARQTDRRR
ncbi:MAG: hypothetical protein WC749_08460 [Dehalococcoidia bacterium]